MSTEQRIAKKKKKKARQKKTNKGMKKRTNNAMQLDNAKGFLCVPTVLTNKTIHKVGLRKGVGLNQALGYDAIGLLEGDIQRFALFPGKRELLCLNARTLGRCIIDRVLTFLSNNVI